MVLLIFDVAVAAALLAMALSVLCSMIEHGASPGHVAFILIMAWAADGLLRPRKSKT